MSPRWQEAQSVLLQVRAGMTVEHALARLRVGLGVRHAMLDMTATGTRFDDELVETANLLDTEPALVFIDDIHHLDLAKTAQMLGYLSRHVRKSRIFVASRLEVPLPPGAPVPVVIRLAPLDVEATAKMAAHLASQLDIKLPDTAEIYARSGGSPFLVQRLLAGDSALTTNSALHHSLRELSAGARRLLLLFAVIRSRFTIADLLAAAGGDSDLGDAQALTSELARRFLIDVSRGTVMVHDLIRDALVSQAGPSELASAHLGAAALHTRWYDADAHQRGLDAVEAIHHLIGADDVEAAWSFVQARYPSIAAAGLDHLLVDSLTTLRNALDEQQSEVDLMLARILIRRSRIAEADEVLAQVSAAGHGDSSRYLSLASEVAVQHGRLREAEELAARALSRATSATQRFQRALQLADVRSLRGNCAQARADLDSAIAALDKVSQRDRGRWSRSRALSYLLDECYAECAQVAREAVSRLSGSGADDLVLLLTMLEAMARAELGQVTVTRELIERVVSHASTGVLRERLLAMYTGILRFAEGDLRGARVALETSFAYVQEQGDLVNGCISGHYLGRVMVAQGDVDAAVALSAKMIKQGREVGAESLIPTAIAAHAEALLAGGRAAKAKEVAEEVLASSEARPRARWVAHAVLMRCLALSGDLAAARRQHEAAAAEEHAHSDELAPAYERAMIELLGGDTSLAVDWAQIAWRGYAGSGRCYLEARSAVVLAAALMARGRSTDVLAIEEPLLRAEELASQGEYPIVAARCALVRAALRLRAGDTESARQELQATARALGQNTERPEMAAIRAALGRTADDVMWPGERSLVAALGLASSMRYRIVNRDKDWIGSEADIAQVRTRYALVVEPVRAVITAPQSQNTDQGRPIACELLARLIEAQGAVVTAEMLFRDVWGGREYHPLQHRNTVYVAVKRLRQTLRKLLGDQEVIETASGGWRLAEGIDAVSVRPLD